MRKYSRQKLKKEPGKAEESSDYDGSVTWGRERGGTEEAKEEIREKEKEGQKRVREGGRKKRKREENVVCRKISEEFMKACGESLN